MKLECGYVLLQMKLGVATLKVAKVRGSKQILVDGHGDKRQYTLMFGITADGYFAGRFQLIWNKPLLITKKGSHKQTVIFTEYPNFS